MLRNLVLLTSVASPEASTGRSSFLTVLLALCLLPPHLHFPTILPPPPYNTAGPNCDVRAPEPGHLALLSFGESGDLSPPQRHSPSIFEGCSSWLSVTLTMPASRILPRCQFPGSLTIPSASDLTAIIVLHQPFPHWWFRGRVLACHQPFPPLAVICFLKLPVM